MNGHSPGSGPQPMLGRQVLTEMLRRAKYRAHGEANRAEAGLRIETQERGKSGSSHGRLSTICSRDCLPYPQEVSTIYKEFMPNYTGGIDRAFKSRRGWRCT